MDQTDAVRSHNRKAWNAEVERGNRWTVPVDHQAIEAARRGRLEVLLTDCRAVPAAWFEEMPAGGQRAAPEEGRDLAGRVERLFGAVRHPKTGEPYTSAEVARMSAGDLTGGEVEKIRIGVISDPTVKQVAALAAAFGVPTSYLLDRSRDTSVLEEEEVLEALADETAGAILRQSARLPEREKRIVLGIVRQIGSQLDAEDGR